MARERNLDLIQVTEKVEPPVCRIEDYGKYLYREEKKSRAAKKPQGGEMKSIRLTFNISQHDLETRARQAEKFLSKGDLVKIDLVMRGREKTHQDFAREKMAKFLEILKTIIPVKTVKEIRKEARGISMMVSKQ
jgi:translation initiation factor IF-3